MPGRKTYVGTATETTLNGAITATATSLTVADGSTYGAPTTAAPMVIVVGPGTANEEQILISARATNTLTVATNGRNWHTGGSGTGLAHSSGEIVRHVLDADSMDDANAHTNDDTRDDHSQYLNTARHTAIAHSATFHGCSLYHAASPALTAGTTYRIPWDTEAFDIDGWHAAAAGTIVIPAGFTGYARFSGAVTIQLSTSGWRRVDIYEGTGIEGSGTRHDTFTLTGAATSGEDTTLRFNRVLAVTAGQTYRVEVVSTVAATVRGGRYATYVDVEFLGT